jgi:hypothetical protein
MSLSVGSRSGICSYTDNGSSFCIVKHYVYFFLPSLPCYVKSHEETNSGDVMVDCITD